MSSPKRTNRTKRRLSTLVWGAIPVVLLGGLVSLDHIPGTDISLTVPYAAQGPGPTFNTLGEVDGEPVVDVGGVPTDDTAGNLNMTTVSVRTNMTLAQTLGRWLTTEDTLVPAEQIFPPNVSPEELEESNQAAFTSSEAAATVAAMNYLGLPVEVEVASVVEGSAADGLVEAEDTILAVNGEEVDEPGQVAELVQAHGPGDSVTLTVERGGEQQDIDITLGENPEAPNQGQLGVLMTSAPVDQVDVEYNLNDIGGPSAGMMFSLAVIDKLSPGALNGGNMVAGTGTISEDGSVGPIGGIVHKINASEEEGVELFLAPSDNCAEAVSRDHGDMVVASVDTIDDAITQMDNFANGDEVDTCSAS